MTTSTKDQIDQLRSLKHALLTALRFDTGFTTVQALTRRAFVEDLITNKTQQAILETCQPLHLGLSSDPNTSSQMVSEIETAISTEITTWRRLANECG